MPFNQIQMLMRMASAMRSGGNPFEIVRQLSGGNPIMEQGLNMIEGKSPAEIKQMAMNMTQQRGIDSNLMLRQLQQMGIR